MIRYFISFSHQDAGTFGTGNLELNLHRPVQSMEDIQTITGMLLRNGISNPLVLSFSRFDDPVAERTTE